MKFILTIIFFISCNYCNAQRDYLNLPKYPYDKITDSTCNYSFGKDTTQKCTYNFNTGSIEVFDLNNNLVETGSTTRLGCDGIGKNNIWKKFYKNGSIKAIENYYKGYKIDTWKYFYEDGTILRIENYFLTEEDYQNQSLLISEYEYYKNRQPKMDGQYVIDFYCKDSLYITDPSTGIQTIEEMKTLCPKKCGTWNYYFPDGSLMKKEEY